MKNISNTSDFLQGGGEMGELMRSFDWKKTSLGEPGEWPLSLKTTIGIILHSAFPMFLFWGKELLCFYNDAYRPSLGIDGKHPLIGKGAKEGWPDIWDFIGPIIDNVMKTGIATWYEDQLLPIYRNGKMEDVYWTFSYSPAYGDQQKIEGVFVTCTETTGKVKAIQTIKEEEAKFRALIEEAPVATCLLTGSDMRIELANDSILKHWGKGKDVIGKTVLEALPELKDQPFPKLLDEVFTTGNTYEASEAKAQLVVNGVSGTYYFHLTYKAVRNPAGDIYGVMCMSVDVTTQVLAKKALDESSDRLEFTIEAAELGTFNLNPKTNKFIGNARLKEWFGLAPDEEIELQLATNVIADRDRDKVNAAIAYALNPASGGMYDVEYTIIHPKTKKETVVKAKGKALFDEADKPYNFSGTLQDITEEVNIRKQLSREASDQKTARQKAEESEAHLQLLRDTVPAMIFYLDEEQRYLSYNGVFMDWFNVSASEVIGKTVREFIGEEAYSKTLPNLTKAYSGEQARYEMYAPSRMKGDRWLSIVYTPHFNNERKIIGMIVHSTDITEHVLTRKKIEESELFSREVIHNSPVAKIVYTGKELTITIVNKNMLQLLGRNDSILGQTFVQAIPELKGTSLEKRMNHVFETGETYIEPEEKIELVRFGKPYTGYYSYTYKALRRVSGEIYGMMATATEITEQVVARHKIEAKEKELRGLIAAAPIGICVVSGKEVRIEEVNEKFIEISGKAHGQFAGATYWDIFAEVAELYAPVLENVFKTGIKYTTPEAEMVLIRSGVPEKVYVAFDYVPVFDSNNVVSKVIVIVVEVTKQVETRKKIEAAVTERTKELDASNLNLKRSNSELEQFAYIASHDLQEPIRKISTFTQMLEHSLTDASDQSKNYISKIYSSADRMTKLIRDVLAFSQISQQTGTFEQVDLSKIMRGVETDFELLIQQKQAVIEIENLPVVHAVATQMTQLFSNLVSNSLKYTKPGVPPVIRISSAIAKKEKIASHPQLEQNKKYYHIQVSDNGIGFDQEHADRIFKIFQRLHGKTEFEGTGIGLSICRKIVQTHNGHIAAAVGKNGGAIFNIVLPVKM